VWLKPNRFTVASSVGWLIVASRKSWITVRRHHLVVFQAFNQGVCDEWGWRLDALCAFGRIFHAVMNLSKCNYRSAIRGTPGRSLGMVMPFRWRQEIVRRGKNRFVLQLFYSIELTRNR